MTTENMEIGIDNTNSSFAFNDNGDKVPVEETQQEEGSEAASESAEAKPLEGTQDGMEAAPPPYNPTMKYKYEGKELPIDELFKPLLTSEEAEKKIRELHEIRDAFPKYKETYEEYKQIAPQYQSLVGELQELGNLRQQNLPAFLEKMQVQPQDVLEQMDPAIIKQHVARLYALEDLTPEQRHAYNQQQQALKERDLYQRRTQELEQQVFQRDVERKSFELDQSMGTSDVKDIQAKFDKHYGSGAFKNEVIQAGQIAFKLEQRDLSPREAIERVMKKYSPLLNQGSPQMVQAPTGEKVKVIPNVTSRPVSPGKTKPRSLDDIRKLADSMED